jgi:ABC-2 type transport system permease protein
MSTPMATSGRGRSEATRRTRPPSVAVTAFALRACFPRKRRWGLLLPCAMALLFGLLARSDSGTPAAAFARVAANGLFGLLLPIACLVIGDAVMGADVRAGTLPFTWLSPVPFRVIAVARWTAGTIVAWMTIAPAFALAAVLAGVPRAAAPAAVATVVGAGAYVAVFVLVGCATRRATVWSLGVVLLGEGLVATALVSIAHLSPRWLAFAVFGGLTEVPSDLVREGLPRGWGAAVQLVVVTVICLALSGWRLRHLRLSGSSD